MATARCRTGIEVARGAKAKGGEKQRDVTESSQRLSSYRWMWKSERHASDRGADKINTAGPFQRRDNCAFQAIDSASVPDICGDSAYSAKAKALNEKAKNANISAITCAGIYPGVSNLMALDTAETQKEPADEASEGKEPEVGYVLYNYFTAESGGVRTTILATSSYLWRRRGLLGERERGSETSVSEKGCHFGEGVGKREVFLYNLPEVASTREFGCRQQSAFGTSQACGTVPWSPSPILSPSRLRTSHEGFGDRLCPHSAFSRCYGWRDNLVRVEVKLKDGKQAVSLYTHPRLSEPRAARRLPVRGEWLGVWYQKRLVPLQTETNC